MFIEFGRLGCKHIIYLGAVMFIQCMCKHMPFWLKHHPVLMPVVRILKTHPPGPLASRN